MAISNPPALSAVQARVRRPAVAGYFYPADPQELRTAIEATRSAAAQARIDAAAVVAPHGSYRWSGAVLGGLFGAVDLPRRVIVLGPSHAGLAGGWSMMASGAYETPLGEAAIDEDMCAALQERCPFLEADPQAQQGEHAVEVLVPYLQQFGPAGLALTPLICGSADPVQRVQLASALADAVRRSPEPVLLVASSDLTHFEPAARADALDRLLIGRIAALDPEGLLRASREHGARMCGDEAVAAVLQAASLLGAGQGRVTGRATSAEGGGDPESSIGYAGIIIT